MTMSCFREAQHQGHLKRLQQIYGCLIKFKYAKIRFLTHQPDYSDVSPIEQHWESIYGDVHKQLPTNDPPP